MINTINTKLVVKNIVTGGGGFLGSHLIDNLLLKGEKVICIDNFCSSVLENLNKWKNNENLKIIKHDIIKPLSIKGDRIWHLACPASPIHYQNDPILTAKTCFIGTYNMLEIAKENNAKFLLASTSEVYGNPRNHPQKESYNGNVNPIGPRSCYVEGKRISETLCLDFKRIHNIDIKIIRIFNTYGPRMRAKDGRLISNFILSGLEKSPFLINGDGSQTRSFCYVDDLIKGMVLMMNSNYTGPINLGNPVEYSVKELARLIMEKLEIKNKIIYRSLPLDDPLRRKPNINLAKKLLLWEPKINISCGLDLTINYFKNVLLNN